MATRPIWRGHLRLALVTCPIALHSVVRASGELRFHFINPKTGNRVRSVMQDAETDAEVSRRDLARGYEFEKDHYVLLDDEDFEKAKIDASSTVTIDKFVALDSIDPIYFDTSYYVVPDGDAGADVFAVLRAAIAATGQAALARVVIARRERAVAIRPMGKGLACHTLHEPREINDAEPLFDAIPDAKPDAGMVKLATQLIERQEGRFEPTDSEDHYEARLREVIAAKLKGEGITPEETEAPARDNVIDLMAALKASLGRGGEKAAAKPAPARKAAAARNKSPAKRGSPTRKRA
ncbi:MAG TPA: Ku protein [Acetobacteraceae bacterium]|nr:Ku protein [Acetobacteraceae bacterium]